VRGLYGHPDAALARERTRQAFRDVPPIAALPPQGDGGRAPLLTEAGAACAPNITCR